MNTDTEQDAINPQLSSVEKQQIVAFQTGGEMIHASKPNIQMDKDMLRTASEDREHGIKDFLGRPIPVFSGVWNTSHARATIIPSSPLVFPQTIWSQPMWANKLKGFRFLRATLNFQIQVNASPFDQGRLLAFWSPFDAERGDLRPFYSRTNWTGYPCVEIDVGNQMTAELKIPYVSPFSALDQTQPNQPYGIFRLGVIIPFNTSNETSVDVTVYCWLTDVDLSIPTDFSSFGMVGQSGKTNEAFGRSKLGLVSGSSKLVGEAARMFANTPGISGVAKPVAWMSDIVGGAASLLGFSKPTSEMAIQTVANTPGKGFTNYDGLDNSIVLGTTLKNEVEHSPNIFGTDIDEMNISYIISKWNFFQDFAWTTGDPAKNNALFKLPIHPGICGTDAPSGVAGLWQTPTQLAYVASMFRLWRGGISLRFSAVKNQYYSGRLVFVYYPGVRAGEIIDYTTLDVSNCYKWIWDIRQDSDLELTIPYNANTQFLRTRMHRNTDSTQQESLGIDTISGTLVVFVDNQLRAPATVPDNFNIAVWIRGASDTTFAIPDCVRYGPYYAPPDTALLPSGFGAPFKVKLKAEKPKSNYIVPMKGQMMKVESTFDINQDQVGKANKEGSSMLYVVNKENMTPELYCTGEVINNLRPLTRRYMYDYSWLTPGTSNQITLDPAFFFGNNSVSTRAPLNYIARMYVFYKGGVRYKIFNQQATPAIGTRAMMFATSGEIISTSPRSYQTVPANATSPGGGRFMNLQFIDINPVMEITCPFYSNVPMQIVSKTYITSNHLRMIYKYFDSSDPAADGNTGWILKAASDDFSFGYLVGAPLLLDYTEV